LETNQARPLADGGVNSGPDQARSLEAELEKTRRARRRFFWAFSHELRTPLNVILCYNDLLSNEVLGPLNERQQQATTRMAASIRQLKQLMEGIFELSELESRSVAVAAERVELRALAESVVAELQPLAHARGLYLRVEGEEPEVATTTDGVRLRRILLNICMNALQMTTQGGAVIRVGTVAGRARIDVVDTGPGLDEVEREQIFEEFAQFGPAQRHAGLALALAHRLALVLGAELEVSGKKGEGSIFTLSLPARLKVAAGG
jgi:signal transduction histidine kinase